MTYDNITRAVFVDRPNRFVAHADIGGVLEAVHVKNTGRCRELLVPGAEIWLTAPDNPSRKTRYDLVAVRKANGILFNIDSQAPNKAVYEWLAKQPFDKITPEYAFGGSRIDFYMERGRDRFLMEVKGCTLEIGGTGYFPDAPTERGVKHIRELIRARGAGYRAILTFVIQMDGVTEVKPNIQTHPAFGEALAEAEMAGVQVLCLPCHVEPEGMEIWTEGAPDAVSPFERRHPFEGSA